MSKLKMDAPDAQNPFSLMTQYWTGLAHAWINAAEPFLTWGLRGQMSESARWDLGMPPLREGLMPVWWPSRALNLVGDARIRGLAITRPAAEVAALLPPGVVLGTQSLTPEGTHPLVFFFSDFSRMRMSLPTLTPEMSYKEEIIGIPFAHVTEGRATRRAVPALYLVRLFLDRSLDGWLAMVGGRLYWGYPKDPARIDSSQDRFLIHGPASEPVIDLTNTTDAPFLPANEVQEFAAWREIQRMPLVTRLPLGVGPLCVLSDYDKKWDITRVRPLHTALDLVDPPLRGVPRGRFPESGWAPGFDRTPLGSFEMQTRIRGSLPYPPWLPNARSQGV